jgi:hypothetical protein
MIRHRGQAPQAKEVLGLCPRPNQEALPPGPPPRAVALGTIHFGWGMEEGRHRPRYVTVGPLPFPNQWTDCKGPRPLLGVQGAKPLAGPRAEPSRFLCFRRLP